MLIYLMIFSAIVINLLIGHWTPYNFVADSIHTKKTL